MRSVTPFVLGALLFAACSQPDAKPVRQKHAVAETSVIQPMEGLEIAPREFRVSADNADRIELPNGGSIAFPAHAFVDANGNPVSGTVTVEWQEFHSLADILVSGIPMNYDSAGVTNHFVSGGMFTIAAHQGGQNIELAKGKEATVALATYDAQRQFNFYSLNEQTGDWSYRLTAQSEPNPNFDAPDKDPAAQDARATDKSPVFLNVEASNTDSIPALNGLDIVGWNAAETLSKKMQRTIAQGNWNVRVTDENSGQYTLTLTRKDVRLELAAVPVTMDDALANTHTVEQRTEQRWADLLAFQQSEKEAKMLRTASIPGFGTYNWDYVHNREEPIQFALKLHLPEDHKLADAQIYHVCPEERSIIRYYDSGDMALFSFEPSKRNCIIAIFPDKSVYAVSDDQFDKARDKKGAQEFTFDMQSRPERFSSGNQLGRIMNKLI